jgi:rubrerythrin
MAQITFAELSVRDILTLAISNEEEDSRIYQDFADQLRERYPHSAKVFDAMAEEERSHRDMLYGMYKSRFGDHLSPIRREDVKGFLKRRAVWLVKNLGVDKMRQEAEIMEMQAANFYEKAADRVLDVDVRAMLLNLAEIERNHEKKAGELIEASGQGEAADEEAATKKRMFVLQYVQPGLAGLMDGSVSTLAPLFAAAFATHNNWSTFLVGLAASIGAGISMGFAEALSDDGSLTDDDDRRHRSHDPLSRSRFASQCLFHRHSHRDGDCVDRALGNCLDSRKIYGYALFAGRFSGGCRGVLGVSGGDLHRKCLTR